MDFCSADSESGRPSAMRSRFALGIGELSSLVLAKEVSADIVLFDDLAARNLAQRQGFRVQGTIGVLEACYARGYFADLRTAFTGLLAEGIYLDGAFLNARLNSLKLPPL